MKLPVIYDTLAIHQVRPVREQYIKDQDGLCYHCKAPLSGMPSITERGKRVDSSLFPKNFFKYPVHLHHSHETGLTIGAVHNHCNAVLWQYHGE